MLRVLPASTTLSRRAFATGLARSFSGASSQHYERVPSTYHEAWFYSKDSQYEKWQLDIISAALQPVRDTENCVLADVGGGTGRFAGLVHKTLELRKEALCVDPSSGMLQSAQSINGVKTVRQDALQFARSAKANSLGLCLLKEVVHHIAEEDLDELFEGLHNGLVSGGNLVIITRPKEEFDYPFMEKACQVWKNNQPSASVFADSMKRSGFQGVTVKIEGFPVEMKRESWIAMVQDRMWSTFGEDNLSEQELKDGIEEIRARFPEDLRFEERIVVIRGTASKS